MSSKDLEKSEPTGRPATERLLLLLKMRGPQTAADLGSALATTAENARQQLARLAAEGLAESRAERRGVGRPVQLWQLTATGHARFPDTHAELTTQLLRTVRETLGAEALDRLIAAREAEVLATYREEIGGASAIRQRVARLASIRSREGYMADWHEQADGSILFVENHCPICAAATACAGFCRSELAVFRNVLGPSMEVERVEHIPAGARRCAYRIAPTSRTQKRRKSDAARG
jgi:predicted ArsR family transcriptional regulator